MQPAEATPVPESPKAMLSRRSKLLLALGCLPALCFVILIILRLCGLLRPFSVPTGAMTPAVSPGDHIMMEGFTFLRRQPCRGDIIVFKTDGIAMLPPGQFYVKRIAGEPGDHVQISEGKLF